MRPLSLVAAAAALALACVGAAQAYPSSSPAARVETQLRPDFGLLLKPTLKKRHYRPWRGRYPRYGYGPGFGPGPWQDYGYGPPGRDVAFVDCSRARPNEVNWALASLRPGGTLILRAQGAACLDNVIVTKPVTIQADGGAPFRAIRTGHEHDPVKERMDETVSLPVTLKSRPGGPCLVVEVAPDVQGDVILRDLVIEATNAGDESCLYVRNSNVRLERSAIRYAGDGSAIYVDGGSVTTDGDVRIDANTYGQAVYVEDGFIDFEDVTITRAAIAIQIEPSGAQPSRIRHSRLFLWPAQSPSFGAASAGIVVPGSRKAGQLVVEDTKICGFGIGLWVEGANVVELSDSRICRSGKGVLASGGQTKLRNNVIGARTYGVHVGAGQTNIASTKFYGTRARNIFVEPGGPTPVVERNQFYSSGDDCRWRPVDDGYWGKNRKPRWSRRYQDRYYLPSGGGGYGECRDPRGLDYGREEQAWGFEGDDFYGSDSQWPEPGRRVEGPWDRYDPSQDYRDYDRGYRDGPQDGYGPDEGPGYRR